MFPRRRPADHSAADSITVDLGAMVTDLYRRLLNREPDEVGLRSWSEIARTEGTAAMVEKFVMSEECRRILSIGRNLGGRWSLSQYGEVEFLLAHMSSLVAASKTIVDVGASGIDISNSVDMIASLGWRGILIEANPAVASQLTTSVAGMNATVVNCAVAPTDGEATFYLGSNDHLSSLKRENTEWWGDVRGEITVTTRRLAAILEEHGVPHQFAVLSLDIEGVDFEVMNDLVSTSPYRPQWIIIEWGPGRYEATLNDPKVCAVIRDEYVNIGGTHSNVFLQHRSVGAHS